jgi:transposase-like protein
VGDADFGAGWPDSARAFCPGEVDQGDRAGVEYLAEHDALERALGALWNDLPLQRCTVHKHRTLLAHAPKRLHEEVSADYTDMIYAGTAREVEAKRVAFLRKWRLRCKDVADSLREAGDKLFTFQRFPTEQWKSIRTTNAIERLH